MSDNLRAEALDYHARGRAGKLQMQPTKPMTTQHDLALAYSPGVAVPCEEIAADPSTAALYTSRANTVAVISNGSAVLGLGNIGALASKPVMEGKAVLFKKFAGIDSFDLEVDEADPHAFVEAVARLEPSFGGINLEDIKAPECFIIEQKLKERMAIPVFHDDQHGTAIVCAAGILNSLEIVGKKLDAVKIVANGAGAAALACLDLLVSFGADKDNIIVCDSRGVIHTERDTLDQYKGRYAAHTGARTLADAMAGADIFLGLSVAGAVNQDMVKSMADDPILFAMANPDPEITPEKVRVVAPNAIVATGRSDYPNQVNNVLCFPFLFRGALDCGASGINEEMKRACAIGIAELAKKAAPHVVLTTYNADSMVFGRDYIIPKPFDPRLITEIAPLVAQAAMDSGVAARPIADMEAYKEDLRKHVFRSGLLMKPAYEVAASDPKRVVYAEGESERVLHCANLAVLQGIARPVLVGNAPRIKARAAELGLSLDFDADIRIIDPETIDIDDYASDLHKRIGRSGVSLQEARRGVTSDPTVLACLALARDEVDAVVCGTGGRFGHHLERVESIIGRADNASTMSTLTALVMPKGTLFVADAHVNLDPSAEVVADIAEQAAAMMRSLGVAPRAALLSHANFGDRRSASAEKMRAAAAVLRSRDVDFEVDGEMHASSALNAEHRERAYGYSALSGAANLLVMPNADAAHITIGVLRNMADAIAVGPILIGAKRPAQIVSQSVTVRGLLNVTAVSSVQAAG